MDASDDRRLRWRVLPPRLLIVPALLALAAADAEAAPRPTADLRTSPRESTGPGVAVSRDRTTGAARLLWTANAAAAPTWLTPEAAARVALERHRDALGVPRPVIAGARLRFVHDTGRGGIIVVLRPTVAGVEVFNGDIKVLLDRQHRPMAITGAPHPGAHPGSAQAFTRSEADAVTVALAQVGITDAPRLQAVAGRPGWTYHALTSAHRSTLREPARTRPVYFPVGEALVPAYFVELQVDTRGALAVSQYVVAADDGRLLLQRGRTAHEAYNYRVWADADGDHRPADGPLANYTPHPTGEPGLGPAPAVPPVLVTMEGFNRNPNDVADPWLPAGAIETRGNNVDAYVDHAKPNGLDETEFRAKISGPNTFDYTYDVLQEPLASVEQSMAAIVQLFYINNWLHDDWYNAGFTEAAGNAQDDNFGRGGVDGDALRAEAQDAALDGARNNANMSTPADGAPPTMQMYLWGGLNDEVALSVTPLGLDPVVTNAQFGPGDYDVTAELVLLKDGMGKSPTDGCEEPQNPLAGKIALVDRGNCTFEAKVHHAQDAGAVGVVIVNNIVTDGKLNLGNDVDLEDPTLPAQGISIEDGAAIKEALQDSPQTAHMFADAGTERDGTIDGMIVAHEWGHYIHHRLTECGSRACGAMGEGWGDFLALHTTLREGDDMHGTYGMGVYATFDPGGYFGIRRVPYSVDFAKNALTFRHIADGEELPNSHPVDGGGQDNSEVHNAGEIWTTMLWESYIALHEAHAGDLSFAEVRALMADYVVAGMILAPSGPNFTEQRDAILMAAAAADPADFATIAGAFAKRGAGSCAVSPPDESVSFVGVVEDFELSAHGVMLSASLADSVQSCDDDGVLDVGELGRIDLEVYNGGALPMAAGATIEVVDPDPALVFTSGTTLTLPAMAPLETVAVSFEVAVTGLTDYRPIALQLRLTSEDSCEEFNERLLPGVTHADRLVKAAKTDDFEAEPGVWQRDGGVNAEVVWRRQYAAGDGFFWHAEDIGRKSDTRLVSPTLDVSPDQALVIKFDHAYSFETSDDIFWDGGVIEVTRDGGETWEDISKYAAIAYDGVIISEANPIHMRSAFAGMSEGYPARMTTTLNVADKLAGETIALRFRVGTDSAAGAPGWDIDNVEFINITNTPFPRWTVDQQACAETGAEPTTGSELPTTGGGDVTGDVPTTGGETPDSTSGGATSEGGSSDESGDPNVLDDGGCGCNSDGRPTGLLALLLLMLPRRRRIA